VTANSRRIEATSRTKGVTLLELLVVMTIIGLLLAVAPPLLTGSLPRMAHESAARELAAALRQVRTYSITHNRTGDLYLDVEARQYWTSESPRHVDLPRQVDLALLGAASLAPSESSGGIRFYPDGSSTGGRIVLSRGERHYSVEVDWMLGKVQISD
jgi:general secretion pathway protein H